MSDKSETEMTRDIVSYHGNVMQECYFFIDSFLTTYYIA